MSFLKIIEEYSRKLENQVYEDIHDARPRSSSPISSLINEKIKSGNNVWLMTDWHFLKWNDETKSPYKRKGYTEIIRNCQEAIREDDLLIFLGDLVDGEVERKNDISAFISKIPGVKILVRGNNDLFDDKWYLDHGFKYVTPKFIWDDITFTHRPTDHNTRMNIHGHIHGGKTYYSNDVSKYNNQMDVAWLDGRVKPVLLKECISKQPEYAKCVKFINHAFGS